MGRGDGMTAIVLPRSLVYQSPSGLRTNVRGFSNIASKVRVSDCVITADKSGQW